MNSHGRKHSLCQKIENASLTINYESVCHKDTRDGDNMTHCVWVKPDNCYAGFGLGRTIIDFKAKATRVDFMGGNTSHFTPEVHGVPEMPMFMKSEMNLKCAQSRRTDSFNYVKQSVVAWGGLSHKRHQ